MTYIIAEIGNTHEGSPGLAKQFIKTAKEVGADAVKFQTHIFKFESIDNAPNPHYFQSESRKNYFNRTSFTIEEWQELKNYAEEEIKIDFISSPFSLEAVDLLEKINLKCYKVPSGEITNIPLLKKIAELGKPVLISTGMSSWDEIKEAVDIFNESKCNITILQCTSDYPCMPERSGLNIIKEMQKKFPGQSIGFSDHTEGFYAPIAAVVMGATVIEKHLTLSKKMYGSDAINSTEPSEFRILCDEIKNLKTALKNKVDKDKISQSLNEMKLIFEKSIVFSRNMNKGDIIEIKDLAFKKPGNGLKPNQYQSIIGRKLKKNVEADKQVHSSDYD